LQAIAGEIYAGREAKAQSPISMTTMLDVDGRPIVGRAASPSPGAATYRDGPDTAGSTRRLAGFAQQSTGRRA
jgi:hypothetical protein